MATPSLEDKINSISAALDGTAAILEEMVESDDLRLARQACALSDHLTRISAELSRIAKDVGQEIRA